MEAFIFSVNFIFKNCASALSFSFKSFKNADDCKKKGFAALSSEGGLAPIIEVSDDFEQYAKVDMFTVAAVTMGDIEKDLDRQGEVGLLQAKSQLRAQVNANQDKGLAMLNDAARPAQGSIPSGVRPHIINGS